jgi:peptide/nickel transport system ATP-binding protein
MALLDVHGLTVSLPHSKPVADLSFCVGRSETVAIVGESGSGKSLTALALLGLLPPAARVSAGKILFQDRDLARLPDRDLRHLRGREIAMIFQEPMTSLNPVVSIGRQVAEVLRRHEALTRFAARRRAVELLDLVRIPEPDRRFDDYPHQLSGGMRQRVMIAIAIACSPKLLIADEPTTALDVTIQAQVLDLLDRLRRELDMALLLITHDLAVVAEWADRIVVMYAGRKVEEAAVGALFSAPVHPYTRGLLSASPRLSAGQHYTRGRLVEIPGSIISAAGEPGCAFLPRCREALASCRTRVPPLIGVGAGHSVACPVAAVREVAAHGAVVG